MTGQKQDAQFWLPWTSHLVRQTACFEGGNCKAQHFEKTPTTLYLTYHMHHTAMTKPYNAVSLLIKSHMSLCETYSFQYYTDVTVRNKENKTTCDGRSMYLNSLLKVCGATS